MIKILLTDDDKTIRSLYDKFLSSDDFEKRFAGNGSEALEVYQEWRPDIMVLDLMMPVMSGFEVLQEIRKVRKDLATKIIVASSLNEQKELQTCIDFGIHGYLIKPFTANALREQINIVKLFPGQG